MSESKLAQVRAMLAKAERTDNEHEADAYKAKAMQLIVKYGIDEALLAAHDGLESSRVQTQELTVEAPFAQEKVNLYNAVGWHMGIRITYKKVWKSGLPYRENRSDRQVVKVTAYGRKGDLEAAEILYTSLLLQQASEFTRVGGHGYDEFGQDRAAYRRSWLEAYAGTINVRMRDEYAKQTASTPGAGLVLVDKEKQVTDALRQAEPDAKNEKPRKLSGKGWADGYHAALRADIGTGADELEDNEIKEIG